MDRLAEELDAYARPAELAEPNGATTVRCLACAHRCVLRPGQRGICRVRFNRGGRLFAPAGYVSSLHADPIEKKPFYHVLPGTTALTFGTLGCNFRCAFCQNWEISQALRDEAASGHFAEVTSADVAGAAVRSESALVVSSYNEPTVALEWTAAIFKEARQRGRRTGVVSNGFFSTEAIDFLQPLVDCVKIDLKAADEDTYRRLGGHLQPVLDSIARLVARGVWVEVVTLVIPGVNDSNQSLRTIARAIAAISPSIPWHVTAFHPDYRFLEAEPTSAVALRRAATIGHEAKLRFIYAGNLAGSVGSLEATLCPKCGAKLIDRHGVFVLENRLAAGQCPECNEPIPGIWADLAESAEPTAP